MVISLQNKINVKVNLKLEEEPELYKVLYPKSMFLTDEEKEKYILMRIQNYIIDKVRELNKKSVYYE